MIRHVVFLAWKDGTTEEEIRAVGDGLRALPAVIPEIEAFSCGPDLGLTGQDYDFALVGDFADEAAWRAYQEHPDHVALLEDVIAPITTRRTRVQFEV